MISREVVCWSIASRPRYLAEDSDGFSYDFRVVIIGQHTFADTDPWESEVTMAGQETDCSSLLDHLHKWALPALQSETILPHDNRVLLSGRDFDGSTVGLAGMSVMCVLKNTGSVNMCSQQASEKAGCVATVAHEMGHNFGMNHDGSGANAACPQSGNIMEAVGTAGQASTRFSTCSGNNVEAFFSGGAYAENGQCLENAPTRVMGDPVCRNGLVEEGEDCDCGAAVGGYVFLQGRLGLRGAGIFCFETRRSWNKRTAIAEQQ